VRFLLSVATLTTKTFTSTNSTSIFYPVESETDDEKTDPITNAPAVEAVGRPAGGSISTLEAEISELGMIDFDETIAVDESADT
jgi:hypothetical protein